MAHGSLRAVQRDKFLQARIMDLGVETLRQWMIGTGFGFGGKTV
jgi:hypothetical protein